MTVTVEVGSLVVDWGAWTLLFDDDGCWLGYRNEIVGRVPVGLA